MSRGSHLTRAIASFGESRIDDPPRSLPSYTTCSDRTAEGGRPRIIPLFRAVARTHFSTIDQVNDMAISFVSSERASNVASLFLPIPFLPSFPPLSLFLLVKACVCHDWRITQFVCRARRERERERADSQWRRFKKRHKCRKSTEREGGRSGSLGAFFLRGVPPSLPRPPSVRPPVQKSSENGARESCQGRRRCVAQKD